MTNKILQYFNPIFMFKAILDSSLFGVCQRIGEKVNLSSQRIRLYFIYTSFLTLGSPIFIYLILLFWMNVRSYNREARNRVWDL